MAGSKFFTRLCRAAFLGVGIDHGDSPASSANKEELVAGPAGSSPNNDLEAIGADSVGEEPKSDILSSGARPSFWGLTNAR